MARLEEPITLDGYTISKPTIRCLRKNPIRLGDAEFLITIHEGRNRQVRRMCAAAGMRVKKLVRVREGTLALADLPTGQWRYLTQEEVCSIL